MSLPIHPSRFLNQAVDGRLISAVKDNATDFEFACKGVVITVAGTISLVTNGPLASVIPLTVNAGDIIDQWELRRINSTGTTADGYTLEG